ncbi:F-box protein At3g54460 isoform X2 [Daucus carota subsp. sativus]|uniref:F-box protein At3g54460 isoform X2 n=1 Tax=Daucus carota subsp. sativus TaxID=79200 RepID=UPI003082DA0B
MDDNLSTNHKLCGYLCTILQTDPPIAPNLISTTCEIFAEGSETGFICENGTVLSTINGETEYAVGEGSNTASSSRKKWSGIGLVNGSISVVNQLYALVSHKCLSIVSKVVEVVEVVGKAVRVVVLVDVYLPIQLWSGWQFPRSATVAAALCRHLSCNWEARRSLLQLGNTDDQRSDNIWNISDCHVLGCKLQCVAPGTSKKKLFELHDIFMSLPSLSMKGGSDLSRVYPADDTSDSGIWDVSDDVLINIFATLGPIELLRVSATCRHLRSLAASIMPCMKLKLFPHQHAAIEWMMQREKDSEVLPHPLYLDLVTEDGFTFYVNVVSGEIVANIKPVFRDFRGGMFCDEPGLGKTITALSLILKAQGTLALPPDGAEVIWCTHNGKQGCGYYEISADKLASGQALPTTRVVGQTPRRGQFHLDDSQEKLVHSAKRTRVMGSAKIVAESANKLSPHEEAGSPQAACVAHCSSKQSRSKKNLLDAFDEESDYNTGTARRSSRKRRHPSNWPFYSSLEKDSSSDVSSYRRKRGNKITNDSDNKQTWIQCDACRKWRKLTELDAAKTTTAWFCSMNSDTFHQNCLVPEEIWDARQKLTSLPGFHTKGKSGGEEENISFFITVLREHSALIDSVTKKALTWLAKLSADKLLEMETVGLLQPVMQPQAARRGNIHQFHRVFKAFGLIKREKEGTTKWYYPRTVSNMDFDVAALRIALCEPWDSIMLYLSKATLIVVPSNLVDHWNTQIQKHVRPGQLRVYIWTDHKKPLAHNLAWDYDIVLTTFNRLSAEWNPHKRSVLMQVHWLRVIFDEGHTLGSSLNLTNKLQMSISLTATSRWLLTGTPTPNTPNSQLSNLQPMLKFLREEVYGQNQKLWENGILRPFEAGMEEGRLRLLHMLQRCMISARKADLKSIPPCIKKVTFVDFTEEHGRSYNELVVTVRRNILLADWNDPSHVESLLNPKQWKFRSTTIKNVRLSCCVAGHIKVSDAGGDIQETMDLLVENGMDPSSEEYAFIRYNILHGGNCMRCNEWCRLPVITPCRHLLCLECVALNSERCTYPGCDNFYEMQSPEILTRPENPNPKWPVPKDLIELQPSYKQDDWHPDWQSTSSSKVNYLVHRLKELLGGNQNISCPINGGVDLKQVSETTSCSEPSNESNVAPSEKIIIFSQFLEHIHVIALQMKSLTTFQHDPDCIALLMDGSAALGLDLSFVTHVFLMEPIWDKSMEEQVISRAHRMGATRPIQVETLAMNGTIEEQMLNFLQDADECRKLLKEGTGKHDRESSRTRRSLHDFAESNYLTQLSFVRTVPRLEGLQLAAQ